MRTVRPVNFEFPRILQANSGGDTFRRRRTLAAKTGPIITVIYYELQEQ